MENILELFYDQPCATMHGQDSTFVRLARIKKEQLDMLSATLSDEQKERLEAYFDAETEIEGMIGFDRFRYAFHLGAQLTAEQARGKDLLLR